MRVSSATIAELWHLVVCVNTVTFVLVSLFKPSHRMRHASFLRGKIFMDDDSAQQTQKRFSVTLNIVSPRSADVQSGAGGIQSKFGNGIRHGSRARFCHSSGTSEIVISRATDAAHMIGALGRYANCCDGAHS